MLITGPERENVNPAALIDPHGAFFDDLATRLALSHRSGHPLSVVLVDVDGLNDLSRVTVDIGRGDRPAGLAYVTNVVDLMLLAADRDAATGQAFNAR